MPSFSIHQFSSGILKPQKNQNGQWVSGGDNGDIDKKSHDVPQEIKDAVNVSSKAGWRGFGIPDACPPQLGHYALIARELENYCVLAVANTQMDNFYRPFIAYRYFWLDKQEFQNQPNFADFDGIATLLYHWKQKGNPQYDIKEWANDSGSYTDSWVQLTQYNTRRESNSRRIQNFISDINLSNQDLNYNEPLIYKDNEIDGSLKPEEVHCLAIQYSHEKQWSINWAWNVRRLENMQDLRVIYCADDRALNWFNQELIKHRPRQNKDGEDLAKYLAIHSDSDLQAKETGYIQETENIEHVLGKFRGTFKESDVLKLMNSYQKHKQSIVNFRDQFVINSFSDEMPRSRDPNIKYVTLLAALAPVENKNILSKLMNLNAKSKEVAIQFLDELLKMGTQNPDCFEHPICGVFCKNFTYTRWNILNVKIIDLAKITFNWINQNLSKYRPVFNQSGEDLDKDSGRHRDHPSQETIQDFLQKFCGQFTHKDVLKLMDFYQENKEDIGQLKCENAIDNLSNEASKYKKAKNIKYATLLAALYPQKTEEILYKLIDFNRKHKNKVAVNFLDDLLMMQTLYSECLKHEICELFCKNFTYTKFKLINPLYNSPSIPIVPCIAFVLLSGVAAVAWIYGQPNISISRTNTSITISTRNNTSISITISTRRNRSGNLVSFEIYPTSTGKQGLLAELLNEYDRQYEPLKLLELNQERSIVRLKKDILGKLLDPEAKEYISRLKDRDPNQVIDARKKEIYTSLKKFTPEIKTEILPVLKLKIQDEVNVTTLQNALKNNDNYTSGKQTYERGNFDIPTKKAVENLQRGYINTLKKDSKKTEIKKDGIVGPNTWNLLKDRLKDLQVETVYQTLINHLELENQTYDNIVSEIKKCQYSNQNEKALMFVNCLEELNKNYLARLLNKYDNQYKELEAWSRNQRINKKIKQEILDKFKDTKAEEYIKQLKHRYPSIVKDARKKEIYTNLEQFTPEIKTENLPVLKLGKQQQDEVDVTALQNALKRNINDLTVQETDERGNFDRPTKEAVENLQGRYIETLKKQSKTTKMEKDGIVGPNTWNLLKDRLKDLQVEKVYETLINHLKFENQTDYNIVAEIKKCRDSNQNEKALKFVSCLEELKKNWNY